MSRLALLLGAVHRTVPAVGDGPGLVALHGEDGLVSGFCRHHGHVQIPWHVLVGSGGVARVECKLFGPRGELPVSRDRCVRGESGGGLRARLGHAARVVSAAEVAVGKGRLRRRARRLGRVSHGRSGRLAGSISKVRCCSSSCPTASYSPCPEALHACTHVIRAAVVQEHDRLSPARGKEHGRCHSTGSREPPVFPQLS